MSVVLIRGAAGPFSRVGAARTGRTFIITRETSGNRIHSFIVGRRCRILTCSWFSARHSSPGPSHSPSSVTPFSV